MDIKRVIVRKPVSDADKKAGMNLIRSTDMSKIPDTIRNFMKATDEEKMQCMHVIVNLDTAAKMLGFQNLLDLSDFLSMYGPSDLL